MGNDTFIESINKPLAENSKLENYASIELCSRCVKFRNWKLTLISTAITGCDSITLTITHQGGVKPSPAKTLTKTHASLAYLDTTFNKCMWNAHPTILSFLTCMEVTKNNKLYPFVAPVNHNYFNEAKTLSIVHTMIGYFCHSDNSKDSHIDQIGSDACVVVGFNDKVSTPFLFLIQFLFMVTLTTTK